MNDPGRSAQSEYERQRDQRRERRRRRKLVIVIAIAIAFAFGLFLPRLVAMVLSTLLSSVSGEASEVTLPIDERKVSLLLGVSLGIAAAVGLLAPSRSEVAWRKGASGERRVGLALDKLRRDGVVSLHDLAVGGSRANIDHVAVAPSGVFVVDAKQYKGKLEVRSLGSALWINGRNRSVLLEKTHKQAKLIESALRRAGLADITVHPVLCFVDTEMPLLAPNRVGGVLLSTPKSLHRRIGATKSPVLRPDQISTVVEVLKSSFRSAGS